MAKIEFNNQSQLDKVISKQIRKLEYVDSTLTLIPTENEENLTKLIPELIPDVIPDEKKSIEEQTSDDDNEDDDDFDEELK